MKYTRIKSMMLAGLLACNLTACGESVICIDRDPNSVGQSAGQAGGDVAHAADLMEGITPQIVTGAEADSAFILQQTAFALSMLQHTAEEDAGKNLLISPYSVMFALAMTANGADGNTKTEMEQVLGFPIAQLNPYLYTLQNSQPNDESCKLVTANSVWFRDDADRLEVAQDFLQTNADYYGASAFKEPFDAQTCQKINDWCDSKTDHMIPQLLDEIPEEAVMYLINAVVFDAKWSSMYYEYDVSDRPFTAADGTEQTAQMMFSDEHVYLNDGSAQGFLKYYQGGRYAFAALLPNEGIALADYVAGLTAESLQNTFANAEYTAVRAGLPKFSYDYDIELSKTLSAMGMPTAFTTGADFSQMAKTATGLLYINRVLHKTHIDVFEEGTKAAAVTAVEMTDECASVMEEEPKYVILDRPFLYCILDTETNLPVFIGTLNAIPE